LIRAVTDWNLLWSNITEEASYPLKYVDQNNQQLGGSKGKY
jgi:hypothetical protein